MYGEEGLRKCKQCCMLQDHRNRRIFHPSCGGLGLREWGWVGGGAVSSCGLGSLCPEHIVGLVPKLDTVYDFLWISGSRGNKVTSVPSLIFLHLSTCMISRTEVVYGQLIG